MEVSQPVPGPVPRKESALGVAILAAALTVAGTVFGVVLDHLITQRTLDKFERKEVAARLVLRATGRWVRARSVVRAVDSSVFESRWDDYMKEGFTRWNEEYYVLADGVDKFFPHAKPDFAALQNGFQQLHDTLLVYHRAAGSPDRRTRELAARRLEETGDRVQEWATKIQAR
jgi:hypothetical protein